MSAGKYDVGLTFPNTVERMLSACDQKIADADAPDVQPTIDAWADLCRRLIALEEKR